MGLNEIIKIGDKIKSLRKNMGISQKEMASKLNIPYSTYSNYENNNREPSSQTLDKIATILEVSKFDLLYDIDKLKNEMKKYENKSEAQKYYIEQYLYTLGYSIIREMENGYIALESNSGCFEISENDIEDLVNNTKSFIEFKISEIIKKSHKIGK